MTDTEKRDAYLEWIKNYCNNDFEDGVPATVNLAIDKLMEADSIPAGLDSEKKGSKSVSFSEDRYKDIKSMLAPYRKLRW